MNEATYTVEYSDSRGYGRESIQNFRTYREAAEAFNDYGVRTVSTTTFDPEGDDWHYSYDDYGHPVAYTRWGNGVETLYLTHPNPPGVPDDVWDEHESNDCPRCTKYSVHMHTNGSASYMRHYATADTIDAARTVFTDFTVTTDAYTVDLDDPGAWCDVYTYDHRDNVEETHGDPEMRRVARFELGPLGGIRRTV